jgi:calcineurin-like phosphoesterase family protein
MIYRKINLRAGQNVYFFSDPHFFHKNICRGTSQWELKDHGGDDSVRDFDTLDQMNSTIIDNINKMVKEDDWLVCLGDWAFGGIENIWKARQRIVCKKIIHIVGNHDHHIVKNTVLPNCFRRYMADRDQELFVNPEDSHSDYDEQAQAQEIFSGVHSYLELTVSHSNGEKNTYNLFHFPITIWNKAHHDRIHLYGHVHGGYTAPDRSLDVGVDNAFKLFGEYRPFSERDIQKYMKTRSYKQQSHHNKNTN